MDTENTQATIKQKQRQRKAKALRSLLIRTTLLVVILYVLLFHIVGLTAMKNGDMSPKIETGDLLLYYRLESRIKSQDVVILEKAVNKDMTAAQTETGKQQYVCRVVACPGDVVDLTNETGLTINGNAVVETGIYFQTKPYEGYVEYPVTLGENEYFVLADYRNGGVDSRFFGPVTSNEIKGVLITLMRRNSL